MDSHEILDSVDTLTCVRSSADDKDGNVGVTSGVVHALVGKAFN